MLRTAGGEVPELSVVLYGKYPLVITNIAIENGPVEIVDLPI
jgi:hypothetical protein